MVTCGVRPASRSGTVLATAFLLTLAGTNCSAPCPSIAVDGLRVTVLDGPGGPEVCDAMVTARDGAYVETLQAAPPCGYHGARERQGTYSIEVTWQTRMKTIEDVRVTAGGECNHVLTQDVTIALDP